MKTIVLISALSMLSFFSFSQQESRKENIQHHKTKDNKESFVYITSFYGPPKLVYITNKKSKLQPSWAPIIGSKQRNSPPALMKEAGLSLVRKSEPKNEGEQPQVYFDQHASLNPAIR